MIDKGTRDIERYLKLAEHFSLWSKDPSTKIGAVIVGKNGEIVSQGYNGFPRGVKDNQERWDTKELKYKFVVHAEANALYNALLNGAKIDDKCVLYVWGLPVCNECAKGIIQSGIKTVIVKSTKDDEKWKTFGELSKQMFYESGVKYFEV